MLSADIKNRIFQIINNEHILNTLFNLSMRWDDEREYEDFKDYEDVMKSLIDEYKYTVFIKGIKKPFGLVLETEDNKFKIFVKRRKSTISLAAQHIK